MAARAHTRPPALKPSLVANQAAAAFPVGVTVAAGHTTPATAAVCSLIAFQEAATFPIRMAMASSFQTMRVAVFSVHVTTAARAVLIPSKQPADCSIVSGRSIC
eukprot:GHVS01067638.1.p2 GENE.GHVS01067638.1~~GHVS01067638.1.p2  ORF type:complete len:104 (+),score=14.86 GHVS01067638.1:434-745(+)